MIEATAVYYEPNTGGGARRGAFVSHIDIGAAARNVRYHGGRFCLKERTLYRWILSGMCCLSAYRGEIYIQGVFIYRYFT